MRLFAFAVLLVAGCSGSAVTDATSELKVLADTEWELVSIEGNPVPAKPRVTLTFEHDQLGGYAGCNWFGGTYAQTGSRLELGDMQQTLRACAERAANDRETAYLRAFGRVSRWSVENGQLHLRDDSGNTLLVYDRRVPLRMNPDDLIGTEWRLRSMEGARVPTGSTITLELERGRIEGFAGCRGFTGTYTAEGDEIDITTISMNEMECRDEGRLLFEGQFTTDLSETVNYELEGDTLTLVTHPGRKLVFDRR
ncbi:MAG: META domain-containing protein [Acidobacteria bacterium]|nr:META domain-containing protein [Acidobacteriota bacterium]